MWRGDPDQESCSVPSPAGVLGKVPIKEVLLAAVAPETGLFASVLVLLPCFQCSSQSKQFKSYFRPCADHSKHSHSTQVLAMDGMAGMTSQGPALLTFLFSSLLLAHIPTTLAF